MSLHFIYVIFAPPGVYIGRTVGVIKRLRNHGMLRCDWAILESNIDGAVVRDREARWVKYFVESGCEVLNNDRECNRPGILGHTECSRRKMSERALTRAPISEESRRRMRVARLGIPSSNRGMKRTPEQIQRLSEAHRRPWSLKRRAADDRMYPKMEKQKC